MKTRISLFATVVAIMLMTGCPKKEDPNPEPTTLQMSLYTNPTDGTLFQVNYEDGTNITYFGTKDSEGLPVAIETATVTFPGGEGAYQVKLEDGVKPVKVLCGNGTVYEFEWSSATTLRIKAISPSGEVQVSIPVELGTKGAYLPELATYPENIREGVEAIPGVREIQHVQPSRLKEINGAMTFNVIQCGEKVDNAFVTITTIPALGQGTIATTFAGNGAYTTNLPQAGVPPANYEKECSKLGTLVNDVCDNYGYVKALGLQNNLSAVCNLLSTQIQSTFPGSADGQKIISTCTHAMGAIDAICKFNNKTPIGELCNLAHLLYVEPDPVPYKYYLTVTIPGQGTFISEETTFDPSQPSTWDFDLGGSFGVQNLHTVPGDPSPKEGYVAYADVICPDPDGTIVTISVVGTDGYTDSKEYDLSTNAEISLQVPGGAEGVKDVITVTAKGQQWQISLVF